MRAGGMSSYQNERGWELLSKIDDLAEKYQTTVSAIALAWLRAQPSVAFAPIASSSNFEQLKEIMPVVELSTEELLTLTNS